MSAARASSPALRFASSRVTNTAATVLPIGLSVGAAGSFQVEVKVVVPQAVIHSATAAVVIVRRVLDMDRILPTSPREPTLPAPRLPLPSRTEAILIVRTLQPWHPGRCRWTRFVRRRPSLHANPR